MSQGLLLGGPKLRQHCSTYLISSVNVNQLIVMRTVIIAAFFPPRIYIFIIVSILHPSSLIFSTKTWSWNWIIPSGQENRFKDATEQLKISHVMCRKWFTPYLCDSKTSAPTQCYLAFLRPSVFRCISFAVHRNHFMKFIPTANVKYIPRKQHFSGFHGTLLEKCYIWSQGIGAMPLSASYPRQLVPDILPVHVSWIYGQISILLHGLYFLFLATLFRSLLSPHFHFNQSYYLQRLSLGTCWKTALPGQWLTFSRLYRVDLR